MKIRSLSCACAVLAISACSDSSSPTTTPDAPITGTADAPAAMPDGGLTLNVASPNWGEQVIYMVMIDRFANGDPTNDNQNAGEFDPSSADKYSGGDLQGIIDHLDYIQGLGATAVWITPPVANMWWDPLQQSGGYHGYWARNLKTVDEHYGSLETYRKLSSALHERGMYLIQDIVPNHMGNFFQYSTYDPDDPTQGVVRNLGAVPTSRPEQAPFDEDDVTNATQRAAAIYHWTPAISNYNDPNQEANYQVSDLDDLNSENPVVRTALRDSYGYWIKTVGVDAFRVDTAKFVPHDFWNDFFHSTATDAPGIMQLAASTGRDDFLAFGEVFETPGPLSDTLETKVASFLGTPAKPELNSVLDFPLYGEIERVFATGKPTAYMTYRLGKMMDPTFYPDPYVLPTFIDSHDVRRFLSITDSNGVQLLQALCFLFTVPGIPIIYYGTEQGFVETRQAMFAGGYRQTADSYTATTLYQRVKTLADLRKGSPALNHGAMDVLYDNVALSGPFVYRRTQGSETVLILMNTSKSPALIGQLDSKLPAGSTLEVLHSEQTPLVPVVGVAGKMTMVLPARSVIIARATGQTTTPTEPTATITVSTELADKTFGSDVVISGSVSPPTTHLQMVLDADITKAQNVTVGGDGSWSVTLPVSSFPTGPFQHDVGFYAPDAKVATAPARFTSDVVFAGHTYDFDDPVGDDTGPSGKAYTYPTDSTFGHQMDVTHAKVEVGPTTMNLNFTMADFSSVWNPQNGFDHVYFNIYFSLPGQSGAATFMPKLNASVPDGFAWTYSQFSGGFDNVMYTSVGATATTFGASAPSPTIRVDAGSKTVIFTYDRNAFGLPSWSGVKIYVATWDFDGIGGGFRPLGPTAGPFTMGGGTADDPKIMDDLAVITIP